MNEPAAPMAMASSNASSRPVSVTLLLRDSVYTLGESVKKRDEVVITCSKGNGCVDLTQSAKGFSFMHNSTDKSGSAEKSVTG